MSTLQWFMAMPPTAALILFALGMLILYGGRFWGYWDGMEEELHEARERAKAIQRGLRDN